MSLDDTRHLLRSKRGSIAVEAAAGCGKTYEAASLATDLSAGLPSGQEVLVLAHTNAAVHEFRTRMRERGARARALTLDSFALEIVSAYARPLHLTEPIEVSGPSGLGFDRLATLLTGLIERAPSLGRSLANHYPVIILDEHQDCRRDQHEVIAALRRLGSIQVRFFGDPMQAIYGFGEGELVTWNDLYDGADARAVLDAPQRWVDHPALGRWLVSSRSTLLAGTPLDLRKRPAEVRVIDVHGLTARWHPKTDACPTEFVGPLMRLLDSLDGSMAVLAPSNANVYGIRIASRGRLRVYEGVDFPRAHEALAAAEAVQGNPRELSLSILDFVRFTCTGLQQKMVDDCAAALLADRIQLGRKRAVLPLVERFAQLYKDPSIHGWAAVIRGILEEPPLGIKVHLADTLRVAGLVDVSDGLPAPVALERVIRSRKENCGLPRRFTTTIHKAKGREVDHVIVVPVTKSAFNSTEGARRLLYVAMSRARKTVTLVQDPKSPSPLLCR